MGVVIFLEKLVLPIGHVDQPTAVSGGVYMARNFQWGLDLCHLSNDKTICNTTQIDWSLNCIWTKITSQLYGTTNQQKPISQLWFKEKRKKEKRKAKFIYGIWNHIWNGNSPKLLDSQVHKLRVRITQVRNSLTRPDTDWVKVWSWKHIQHTTKTTHRIGQIWRNTSSKKHISQAKAPYGNTG